jgi:hypothetical protein
MDIVISCDCFSIYEVLLKSSWTHLITPIRNFVEVWWRSLFRSTSLGKLCTSYSAPPTSRKRDENRWSLRNFLPRSSLFMFGKAQKSHGYLDCMSGVPMVFHQSTFSKLNTEFNSDLDPCDIWTFPTMKIELRGRNFEVINGLRHVLENWVERCRKGIACQRRYFEKETVTAPRQSCDSE